MDLAKGGPPLGFGGKNSPNCNDEVIPAEIISIRENTLHDSRSQPFILKPGDCALAVTASQFRKRLRIWGVILLRWGPMPAE